MGNEEIKIIGETAQKIFQLEDYLIQENRICLDEQNQKTIDEIFEIFTKEHYIDAGEGLYRAQLGSIRDGIAKTPLSKERMGVPLPENAIGGRASFPGMTCLYLSTAKETALAEMRSWKEADITIAKFRVKIKLKLLDLRQISYPEQKDINKNMLFKQVISYFSRPMEHQKEHLKYTLSQYLACIIKAKGYAGIIYDSNLDSHGKNIALFDILFVVQLENRELYKTKSIQYVIQNLMNEKEIIVGTKDN